jgi:arylsulfatase
VYATGNGAGACTRPGGGTPFRGEKAVNREGGPRAPTCPRWPGASNPGGAYGDFFAHEGLATTFAAAAGEPAPLEEVRKGYEAGGEAPLLGCRP